LARPARTGRPAGAAVAATAAVPRAGIGFAPETIALAAICRASCYLDRETPMTAYLISLALLGLVIVATADALS